MAGGACMTRATQLAWGPCRTEKDGVGWGERAGGERIARSSPDGGQKK